MLKRQKPLKRKTPLRAKKPFWARSKHPKTGVLEPRDEWRRKKPMNKVSKARERRLRTEYFPANRAYLSLPGHEFCHVCIAWSTGLTRDEIIAAIRKHQRNKLRLGWEAFWTQMLLSGATLIPSSEVHHVFGRTGARLLSDERGFCASCRGCRDLPHVEIAKARELGLIAAAADWNSWAALDRKNGLALAA